MNRAGTIAILALLAIVLRMLFAHVTILPGVVVPVAGLVFVLALAAVSGFWAMVIRRAIQNRLS
jgi:hypothetical protein